MPLSLPTAPHATSVRTAHLASLTGLRAVAAAVVFIYHLRNMGYFTDVPQTLLTTFFSGGARRCHSSSSCPGSCSDGPT